MVDADRQIPCLPLVPRYLLLEVVLREKGIECGLMAISIGRPEHFPSINKISCELLQHDRRRNADLPGFPQPLLAEAVKRPCPNSIYIHRDEPPSSGSVPCQFCMRTEVFNQLQSPPDQPARDFPCSLASECRDQHCLWRHSVHKNMLECSQHQDRCFPGAWSSDDHQRRLSCLVHTLQLRRIQFSMQNGLNRFQKVFNRNHILPFFAFIRIFQPVVPLDGLSANRTMHRHQGYSISVLRKASRRGVPRRSEGWISDCAEPFDKKGTCCSILHSSKHP